MRASVTPRTTRRAASSTTSSRRRARRAVGTTSVDVRVTRPTARDDGRRYVRARSATPRRRADRPRRRGGRSPRVPEHPRRRGGDRRVIDGASVARARSPASSSAAATPTTSCARSSPYSSIAPRRLGRDHASSRATSCPRPSRPTQPDTSRTYARFPWSFQTTRVGERVGRRRSRSSTAASGASDALISIYCLVGWTSWPDGCRLASAHGPHSSSDG